MGSPAGSVGHGVRGPCTAGHPAAPAQGLLMSKDGHGFELPVDPRISARQAAADTQLAMNADHTASPSDQARARRDQLALDRDTGIEQALTAARRARS